MKRFLERRASAQQAHDQLRAVVGDDEAKRMINGLCELSKLGMTSGDLDLIEQAALNSRTLAFAWGRIEDVGETCTPNIRCRECQKAIILGRLTPHVTIEARMLRSWDA